MSKNAELVSQIIEDIKQDLTDDEVIQILLQEKVASNRHAKKTEKYTLGEKAADKLAAFVGSWTFICIFGVCLIIWMTINVIALSNPFDPYPFILLNLVLSCIAAIQAPLIMMSQNRQEAKDRIRAENDYKVNLKTEIVIQDLHSMIDLVVKNQRHIMKTMGTAENANHNKPTA